MADLVYKRIDDKLIGLYDPITGNLVNRIADISEDQSNAKWVISNFPKAPDDLKVNNNPKEVTTIVEDKNIPIKNESIVETSKEKSLLEQIGKNLSEGFNKIFMDSPAEAKQKENPLNEGWDKIKQMKDEQKEDIKTLSPEEEYEKKIKFNNKPR